MNVKLTRFSLNGCEFLAQKIGFSTCFVEKIGKKEAKVGVFAPFPVSRFFGEIGG
jgi:hypothetical protein